MALALDEEMKAAMQLKIKHKAMLAKKGGEKL